MDRALTSPTGRVVGLPAPSTDIKAMAFSNIGRSRSATCKTRCGWGGKTSCFVRFRVIADSYGSADEERARVAPRVCCDAGFDSTAIEVFGSDSCL